MVATTDLYELGLNQQYIREAAQFQAGLHLARISSQHKGLYRAISENGEIQAEVSGRIDYAASTPADYPAVGDWVLLDRSDDSAGNAIIKHVLSRTSCFQRKAAGTGNMNQIIAANIDYVFICMSLNRDYNLRRVERYLVIAWDSGAVPVIVLTKADLCEDIDGKITELESISPGVAIVVTSSKSGAGYNQLRQFLQPGKTGAFLGSSGVGKSTLINCLLGEERLITREIRVDDDKGRHATTYRQLLVLPGGGIVIDTPGMREIQIASADLAHTFTDIEDLARDCHYKDCRHGAEPHCAVKRALEEGTLSVERFNSYKKLQQELLFVERKQTMTAAQAEREKIIAMMGSLDAVKQVHKIKHRKD